MIVIQSVIIKSRNNIRVQLRRMKSSVQLYTTNLQRYHTVLFFYYYRLYLTRNVKILHATCSVLCYYTFCLYGVYL